MKNTATPCSSEELLLIGNGNLANHLSSYLKSLHVSFLSWNRKASFSELREKIQRVSKVALCISDKALLPFYQEHPELRKKQCAHFSGALEIPELLGFHPLMSFNKASYTQELYQEIAFVGSAPESSFRKFFPCFKNSYFQIPPEAKAYYHSLCVLGGNFTAILWKKFFLEMTSLGISPKALKIYFQKIQENILLNPQTAVTGPLTRKDLKTIETNLDSLRNDPFQKIYKSFAEVHLP